MPKHNLDVNKIHGIVQFLKARIKFQPEVGIILGTGLGGLLEAMDIELELPYQEIDDFPRSTVESHMGKLVFGHISGRRTMVFSGRFHYYEGYSMQDVTLPVRIMQGLSVEELIISNAAGGLNESFRAGDIVLIKDHINFFPENPLRGINVTDFGIRFPDMLNAYCRSWLELAEEVAAKLNIQIERGVYLGLQGPNLETPAEYAFFHNCGADLVGMSTIPEVIVARHAKMKILAFSIVSNVCFPIEQLGETTLADVIKTVENSGPRASLFIQKFLSEK